MSLLGLLSKLFSKSDILAEFFVIPLKRVMKLSITALNFFQRTHDEVVFGELVDILASPVKVEAFLSLYEGASIHVVDNLQSVDIYFLKKNASRFLQSSIIVNPQGFNHFQDLFVVVHEFFTCQDYWDVGLVELDHDQMLSKYLKIVAIFG